MVTNVDQPDNTLNVTNARSIPNQPIPAGNDGTGVSVNPDATGSTSNALPRSPGTRVRSPGTSPIVTTRPNPNLATTSNASLRATRSPVQITSSRPMSLLERRPTGLGLVSHDPIRGDIGQQEVYSYDVGGERDLAGVPNRRGSENTVGRVSVPPRPRSVLNPVDGTAVEDGHPPGPGSPRGSRFMYTDEDAPLKEKTVQERLQPTIDAATTEKDRYQKRAIEQRITINGAIALQVVFGALTTGFAAAGSRHIAPAVAVFGGLSTMIASYLAKVRGTGEPEFSSIRTRELKSFLREIHAFLMDHGGKPGSEHDEVIAMFRERFEAIISTEEESGFGGQYFQWQSAPNPVLLAPPAAHVAGIMPIQSRPGVMDGKQMMRGN